LDDRPGQVAGEQHDEQGRADQPADGGRDGLAGGGGRAALAGLGQAALGGHQPVELGSDGVDPPPALVGGGHGPGRVGVAPGGRHQWHRVVPDIRGGRLPDQDRLLVLGVVGGEPLQPPAGLGKGPLGVPPGVQEPFLAGDHEPPLAGLDVDDQPLQLVGGGQHLLRVQGQPLRGPEILDRHQQHREGGADDEREQAARDDHAAGQPAAHLNLWCTWKG
jgi:hypothetical protein